VKTPAGWVVLKAVAAIPAGVPPLAEIRERVAAAVKRRKADSVAAERAKQLAGEAKGDLPAAARKAGATSGETQRFSRGKPAERLPGDAQLAALQTPAGEATPPVRTPQGYYVLKVLERADPPPLDRAERDKLVGELASQKQTQAWERWVSAARAGAKIEITGRSPRRAS
jgi:parvulin-like peptidyl-prolyl isomerase